jgi:hypothetical protein
MRDRDFGDAYEASVPRSPTLRLIKLLRQEHPEMERFDYRSDLVTDAELAGLETSEPEPEPEDFFDVPDNATPRAKLLARVREIAAGYGVDVMDVLGKARTRRISQARQHAMRELRDMGLTMPQIGMILHRDHPTILHGIRMAQRRMEQSHV